MTPLFKKLNYSGQKEICVINAPAEFEAETAAIRLETRVHSNLTECTALTFLIAFVKTVNEVKDLAAGLQKKVAGDPVIWFAYPKKTSRKYTVEISRDNGWDSLRNIGLDTVRAVSIDSDWSALRFRKTHYIKRISGSPELG